MSPHDVAHRGTSSNIYSEINLIEIPIRALRTETRKLLSILINRKNTIFCATDENIRVYRRLLSKIGIDYFDGDLTQINDIEKILTIWERRPIRDANLWKFQNILGIIGRWDVVAETNDLFYEDAVNYLAEQHTDATTVISGFECCHIADTKSSVKFDAIVLCAEEDREFSSQLVQRLESLNFKICLQDDDSSMDHNIIRKKCDRLIIIVSPAFLESRAYKVFQTYSQSLRYGDDKNKIIPYLYQSCQLPDSLRFYFVLSYIQSSYADNKDPLKENLASLTASEKGSSQTAAKSKKFFVTKFSMPRVSNWAKWMKRFKKHKKCRVSVNDQFDDQPKRMKPTSSVFNVRKLMREKMVL